MRPEKSRSKPSAKPKQERVMANDLLAALSRHKGLIVIGVILGGVMGSLYYTLMPSKFESSATILLMQNDSASMASEVNHKNASISQDLLATHIGIIQSRNIVTRALGRDAETFTSEDDPKPNISDAAASDSVLGEVANFAAPKEPAETVDTVNGGIPGSDSSLASETAAAAEAALAAEADLAAEAELALSERKTVIELPSIVQSVKPGESPVVYVLDNLYTLRGGEGASGDAQMLTVKFQHGDPEDARKVVSAVVKEYQVFLDAKFQDINNSAVKLIEAARIELEDQINKLSEEYREFRNNAPLLASTSGGANIYSTRYEDLASELSDVLVQIDERSSRIEIVKEGLAKFAGAGHSLEKLALIDEKNAQRLGILVGVEGGEADSATFQALQPIRVAEATTEYSGLLKLQTELKNAVRDRGMNHPEVKKLSIQVEEMKKFLKERSGELAVNTESASINADSVMLAYASMLENDLADLHKRKTDLEARMGAAEEEAKSLVAFEIEDSGLVRKMSRAEELYSSVVERLRDINMQRQSAPLIHEVIAEPQPGKLVSPTLPIAVAIALLGMAFFAGSAVLLAELSDRSVHSAAELAELYGTDIVAHLPDFNASPENRKLMRAAKNSDSVVDPSVMALHASSSPASESFKALRTQLLFTLGGNHRTVAITSARQGDGKSTAIANLAVSIAQAGRRVLLVDCDLRRPRQHALFGLKNSMGLANILGEQAEELEDCVQATPVPTLSVVTCGELPENPAELLSSDRFAAIIEKLRESYDMVLLDCPPLMPVSDAAVIASLVDGMMIVNQVGPRSRVDASSCKKTLDSVGARLLGLIVNRVEESFGGYMMGNYGFGAGTYENRYGYNYESYTPGNGKNGNGKPSSERLLERK